MKTFLMAAAAAVISFSATTAIAQDADTTGDTTMAAQEFRGFGKAFGRTRTAPGKPEGVGQGFGGKPEGVSRGRPEGVVRGFEKPDFRGMRGANMSNGFARKECVSTGGTFDARTKVCEVN